MSLLDIYSSDMTGSIQALLIKELLQVGASDEVIKDIVHPKFSEDQVIQKKKMWMEMRVVCKAKGCVVRRAGCPFCLEREFGRT